MKVVATALADVLVIEPKVFGDDRGYFFESFNERVFAEAVGRPVAFVQDNQSRSAKNVLRGLHYQVQQTQASSCASCMARCTTSWSTCGGARRRSVAGSVSS